MGKLLSLLALLVVASQAQAAEKAADAKFAYDHDPIGNDMFNQPSVKPQEQPVTYPAGVIPTRGKEAAMSREDADTQLTNPIASDPVSIARGKYEFAKNCAACHGGDTKGDTPVAKKLSAKGAVPPDLTLVTYRSDGFMYGTIRNGGINMPAYGAQTSIRDRWDMINYIRSLQPK